MNFIQPIPLENRAEKQIAACLGRAIAAVRSVTPFWDAGSQL